MFISKYDPFRFFEYMGVQIKKLILGENNEEEVNISSLSLSLIVLFFFLFIPSFMALTQNIFFPDNTPLKTMTEDYFMFIMLFVVAIISFFIHGFYCKYNKLKNNLVNNLKNSKKDKIILNITENKWIAYFALAGTLFVFYIFFSGGYMSSKSTLVWFKHPIVIGDFVNNHWFQWLFFIYFKTLTGIVWFEIISLGTKGILLFVRLNNVYKNYNLKLRRFAPDQCGGLKIIGLISLNFFSIIAIAGFYFIGFTVINYQHAAPNLRFFLIFTVVGYIILGPIIFFGPMYSTHKKMLEVKNNKLSDIEKKLEKHHEKIDKIIDPYQNTDFDSKTIQQHNNAIEHLKREKEEWHQVNEWPFDRRIFNGFVSRYVSPLVLFPAKFLLDQGISDFIIDNINF